MNAIRIRKHTDSDTPHLPELRPLIGKTVEILILDETSAGNFIWQGVTLTTVLRTWTH